MKYAIIRKDETIASSDESRSIDTHTITVTGGLVMSVRILIPIEDADKVCLADWVEADYIESAANAVLAALDRNGVDEYIAVMKVNRFALQIIYPGERF